MFKRSSLLNAQVARKLRRKNALATDRSVNCLETGSEAGGAGGRTRTDTPCGTGF
ncbi:hypothetical protein HMPREF0185_02051 [Brevundimonas diminuta 470-4]|nr:hypothetical protein HMPREF0185_02051 [Brevundimonas diminuta 470-4]